MAIDIFYDGDRNLPAVGSTYDFTDWELEEYIKCSKDPKYFIRKYVKIISLDEGLVPFNMYLYQENMVTQMHEDRFSVFNFSRQLGKTTTSSAYFLWYGTFNIESTIGICANKLSKAADIIRSIKLMYVNLPRFLKRNITVWNKTSISFDQETSIIATATTEDSFRGFTLSVLYLDEFAFVKPNIQAEFMASVFPTISSGTKTKVIITSTPNGLGNEFYNICKAAMEHKSNFKYLKYIWSDVPWRNEEWRLSMLAPKGPLSIEKFDAEHNAEFLGSSKTLISAATLKSLSFDNPLFTKGEFLQIYEYPKENHIYFSVVDVSQGLDQDYSTFTIYDITEKDKFYQVAVFRNNSTRPLAYPNIIVGAAEYYNKAYVLIELNDLGAQVADVINDEFEYDNLLYTTQVTGKASKGMGRFKLSYSGRPGVKTTTSVKKIGCSNLKQLMEMGKLKIRDKQTISEMATFIDAKGNGTFAAELGCHDDLVMNNVLFAWAVNEKFFNTLLDIDFRKVMEEEITKTDSNYKFFGYKSVDGLLNNGYADQISNDLFWEKVESFNSSFINN